MKKLLRIAKRMGKRTVKVIMIVIAIIVVAAIIRSCIGNKSQESEMTQLKNNLYDQMAKNANLQEKIDELEKELATEKERANAAEQSSVETTEDETYMKVKFPSNGDYYKEAYDEISFYSDITCTQPIENARFMSAEIDSVVASNGLQAYALRLDSGKVCYCSQNAGCPYLVTEKCYNELKAEQEAEATEE